MVEVTWYCMQCGQHNTIKFENIPAAPHFHYLKSVCGECGADIYILAWKCPNCQETYRIVSNFDFLSAIARSVQNFLDVGEDISIKILGQRCVKCRKAYQLILENIIAF